MERYKIGILTGGGDCAGINPAVKWVVKTALDTRLAAERNTRYEIVGIRNGWEGLMSMDPANPSDPAYVQPLSEELVRTWDRYGGTNLGTSRANPYNPRNDVSRTVLKNIELLELDALIAIGGDDTLGVAAVGRRSSARANARDSPADPQSSLMSCASAACAKFCRSSSDAASATKTARRPSDMERPMAPGPACTADRGIRHSARGATCDSKSSLRSAVLTDRAKSVRFSGIPSTRWRPPTIVRPWAGNAGATSARSAPRVLITAASSAPG